MFCSLIEWCIAVVCLVNLDCCRLSVPAGGRDMPILRPWAGNGTHLLHSCSIGKSSITCPHLTASEDRKCNLGEKPSSLKQRESVFWWTTDSFSCFDPEWITEAVVFSFEVGLMLLSTAEVFVRKKNQISIVFPLPIRE